MLQLDSFAFTGVEISVVGGKIDVVSGEVGGPKMTKKHLPQIKQLKVCLLAFDDMHCY